ncbi:MAG: DUF11 domain-containing protein, partial [Tannerella sp.]|nr:DUF11 domain-containing protein [Tannerella sp.]
FSFYRDSVSLASLIRADSINAMLSPGDDTCVTRYVRIQPPFTDLVLRINDNGVKYPYQPECHYEDSIVSRNPALSAYMKKRAWLNAETDNRNGTYPNPVAVLNGDVITYRITALNANPVTGGSMTVSDTLPAYLNYIVGTGSPTPSETTYGTTPPRKVLTFNFSALTPYSTHTAEFKAETAPGANASQPLFVNRAWVTVSNTLLVPTDSSTYHQGAGVAVVTFAAAAGGSIFNFEPQAVDYRTSLRSEPLLIVPDSGYVFAGWSHPAYVSLKGIEIPATTGILNLDTLLIYGNVELTAVFELYRDSLSSKEAISPDDIALSNTIATPRIWSSGSEILVKPATVPSILRIYTPDGILIKQQTLLTKDITKIKMPAGLYIATLNNSVGTKVLIE